METSYGSSGAFAVQDYHWSGEQFRYVSDSGATVTQRAQFRAAFQNWHLELSDNELKFWQPSAPTVDFSDRIGGDRFVSYSYSRMIGGGEVQISVGYEFSYVHFDVAGTLKLNGEEGDYSGPTAGSESFPKVAGLSRIGYYRLQTATEQNPEP